MKVVPKIIPISDAEQGPNIVITMMGMVPGRKRGEIVAKDIQDEAIIATRKTRAVPVSVTAQDLGVLTTMMGMTSNQKVDMLTDKHARDETLTTTTSSVMGIVGMVSIVMAKNKDMVVGIKSTLVEMRTTAGLTRLLKVIITHEETPLLALRQVVMVAINLIGIKDILV